MILSQNSRFYFFVLTILDTSKNDLKQRVASMLAERMEQGKNKVLWWGSRGLVLRFTINTNLRKCPAKVTKKCPKKKGGIV